MPNNTWKGFERRISRSYGSERTRGMHGPDFTMELPDGTRLLMQNRLMQIMIRRDRLAVSRHVTDDPTAPRPCGRAYSKWRGGD